MVPVSRAASSATGILARAKIFAKHPVTFWTKNSTTIAAPRISNRTDTMTIQWFCTRNPLTSPHTISTTPAAVLIPDTLYALSLVSKMISRMEVFTAFSTSFKGINTWMRTASTMMTRHFTTGIPLFLPMVLLSVRSIKIIFLVHR